MGTSSRQNEERDTRRLVIQFLSFIIPAFALLLGLRIWIDYSHDIEAARSHVASSSHLAQTVCGPVEYATAGEGMPVLVIHGAGGGFDQGLDFARPLSDRGYKVIAPSRFGYLRTPMPDDASPSAQAEAHACLLDSLRIPGKVAVVAGSAGAPSAMQFCLRWPDSCSAMVLMVPLAWREGGPTATEKPGAGSDFLINSILSSDFIFWAMTHMARDFSIKTILATPPDVVESASLDEQERVANVLRDIEPISSRADGLRNDAAIAKSLTRYDLERYKMPVLIIGVADDLFDTFRSASYLADHIPNARFVHYRSGGHLWVGHQKEVFDEIDNFLKTSAGPHRTK